MNPGGLSHFNHLWCTNSVEWADQEEQLCATEYNRSLWNLFLAVGGCLNFIVKHIFFPACKNVCIVFLWGAFLSPCSFYFFFLVTEGEFICVFSLCDWWSYGVGFGIPHLRIAWNTSVLKSKPGRMRGGPRGIGNSGSHAQQEGL